MSSGVLAHSQEGVAVGVAGVIQPQLHCAEEDHGGLGLGRGEQRGGPVAKVGAALKDQVDRCAPRPDSAISRPSRSNGTVSRRQSGHLMLLRLSATGAG